MVDVIGLEDQAREVIKALDAKKRKVVTVESCTGGLLAAALTTTPGASAVFENGFVTYSNASKRDIIGVPAAMIEVHGAVSPDVARAMAEGGLARSGADIGISITGVAGPGASERKPEGLVYFHAVTRSGAFDARRIEFGAIGRTAVRIASVRQALSMLLAVNRAL